MMFDDCLLAIEGLDSPTDEDHVDYRDGDIEVFIDLIEGYITG